MVLELTSLAFFPAFYVAAIVTKSNTDMSPRPAGAGKGGGEGYFSQFGLNGDVQPDRVCLIQGLLS